MPKTTKTDKVDARPSPMKETKVKKMKPSVAIKSKNNKLPVVTVPSTEMDSLQALTTVQDTNTYQPITFNGMFIRQDDYGRFLFKISASEYEELEKVLTNDLEFNGDTNILRGWKDQHQVQGKLSKKYMEQFKLGEIPIPAIKSLVKVEGDFVLAEIDEKKVCWFQINALSALKTAA